MYADERDYGLSLSLYSCVAIKTSAITRGANCETRLENHRRRCKLVDRGISKLTNSKLKLRVPLNSIFYLYLTNCLLLTTNVLADDLSGSSPLDMGALANIASSLGSNPQVVNLVSSFLNQGNSAQRAATASTTSLNLGEPPLPELEVGGGVIVPIPEDPATQATTQSQTNEVPIRRGTKQVTSSAIQTSTNLQTQRPSSAPTNSLVGGNMGSLMSLLPNVMPSLNLSGLINNLVKQPNQVQHSIPNATSGIATANSPQSQPDAQLQSQQQSVPQSNPSVLQQSAPTSLRTTSAKPQPTTTQVTSAQSVINQVLTAYASSQIPNELIQLGLSGRVPPQIIELALSGQVPPQMIQMVVTGQVPMSTINAFLDTIKQPNEFASGSRTTRLGSVADQAQAPASQHQQQPAFNNGVMSTTRTLFEALFNKNHLNPKEVLSSVTGNNQAGGLSLSLPTLLGPIPLSMPKFPTARRIGQLVGGTISSMASMIPS